MDLQVTSDQPNWVQNGLTYHPPEFNKNETVKETKQNLGSVTIFDKLFTYEL